LGPVFAGVTGNNFFIFGEKGSFNVIPNHKKNYQQKTRRTGAGLY
jgi:hypothetical protein